MVVTEDSAAPKCTQCDTPAIIRAFGNSPLCVSHYLMMQQANYLSAAMQASVANFLAEEIDAGTGYIVRSPKINMPPAPFMGGNLNLNNINVKDSAVGGINTGTIQNLDATVTLTRAQGNEELATALQEFTQALHDSKDLLGEIRNEIAEQVDFLMAQVGAEPKSRSPGLIKSALSGITTSVKAIPALLTMWDKLKVLIESAI